MLNTNQVNNCKTASHDCAAWGLSGEYLKLMYSYGITQ